LAVKRFTLQNFFYIASALDLAKLAAFDVNNQPLSKEGKAACVFGAVTASVAFLECSINGLYEHAASRFGRQTKYRGLLASVYHDKLKFDNLPYLTKYQVALALAHKPMLELGKEPYQSADLLNQLRNALIHPKEIFAGIDDWSDRMRSGLKEHPAKSKLEDRLTGRFAFNSVQDEEVEFIPHRCLSPSCALWSVETAIDFFLEFEHRIPTTAYLMQRGKEGSTILKRVRNLRVRVKKDLPKSSRILLGQSGP
jgi:hypothetical protein